MKIPESHLDLIQDETPAYAYLATIMQDGTPQVTPIWFNFSAKVGPILGSFVRSVTLILPYRWGGRAIIQHFAGLRAWLRWTNNTFCFHRFN